MPKGKHISSDLRVAIVAAHQSGKSHLQIIWSLSFSSAKDYSQWKAFELVDYLHRNGRCRKFTQRSDCAILREIRKSPKATSQTPQASVSMLNVKVHNSKIEKDRTSMACLKGFPWGSIFPQKKKKKMAAQPRFAKLHLNKPQESILESNVRPSVWQPKLGWNWVIQQDDDPKHSSRSTTEWRKRLRIKVLQWVSRSPNVNLICA